jgi:hypothetical protein
MRDPAIADQRLQQSDAGPRRVGRPRKWVSEAERKRAYRERLAADLDEPLTLRRELRNERRRTLGLRQENDRLRARLTAADARAMVAEQSGREEHERAEWLADVAARDSHQVRETQEKLLELQAEVKRLEVEVARFSSLWLLSAPDDRPANERSPATARPASLDLRWCDRPGCTLRATCRVQGPRGVERDACEVHAQPDRKPGRWRVLRRY